MANQKNDDFARESFSMRRMKSWQIWGITIAAVAVLLVLLVFNAG